MRTCLKTVEKGLELLIFLWTQIFLLSEYDYLKWGEGRQDRDGKGLLFLFSTWSDCTWERLTGMPGDN